MSRNNEVIINGIRISAYSPTGVYSFEDIESFLKRFQLNEALKLIGQLSQEWFLRQKRGTVEIQGIPVADYMLAYIAMQLIESSNDYRKQMLTVADTLKVADMYWGIPDPIELESERNSESCLLRTVCNQFEYNRPIHYLLERTVAIYRNLWQRVTKAIPVDHIIKEISGLKIEDILVMSYAFTMRAQKGFFRLYPDSLTTDPRIKDIFTQEKQLAFVQWLACGYREFREKSKETRKKIPSPIYEKFRFNPLINYPAIKPDRNPVPGQPQVYILPVARLLINRVTRGLYFELSEHFKGPDKENPFRVSFGYVFQEYIGELFRDAVGKEAVLPERKYGKENKDSPDWIIIKGDRCILVEVKQSGIFLDAKLWGDLKHVKRDLAKTVGKGVRQLLTFEQAVRSGKYRDIVDLSRFQRFEHLIVTYDRPYLSNSLLRRSTLENLREDGFQVPDNFHWHLISVDEIEGLLGLRDPNVFDVLEVKRRNPVKDEMDFGDYFNEMFAGRAAENSYLERIHEEFFSRFE